MWTKFSRSCWLKGFSHYFVGQNWADDLEDDALKGLLPAFIRNSVLSKKPASGSLLGPHKNMGTVSMTVQLVSLSRAGTAHLCPEVTLQEEANEAFTLPCTVSGKQILEHDLATSCRAPGMTDAHSLPGNRLNGPPCPIPPRPIPPPPWSFGCFPCIPQSH